MSALFDIEPLFESINSTTLLLTPNRRLASHLQTAYAQACGKRGIQVWEQPDILPFDDWVQQSWQQLLNNDSHLTRKTARLQPQQETLLWERFIRADDESVLLKPYATAKKAQSAWRTLQLWQCDISKDFYFHPDCNRFAQWAKQFQAHCEQRKLVNAGAQVQRLLDAYKTSQLEAKHDILLVGFQHLPPLYEQLIQQASQRWQFYQPETSAGQSYQLSCEDARQELQLAAQWARQQLETNPNQRLAIIAPELAQQRSEIEQALTAAFEPQYWLPTTPRYQLPFNISAGVPLGSTPLIVSALNLLELLRSEFSYQTLYAILKSPFLCVDDSGDFESSTELELFLRRGGWPVFNLAQLVERISCNESLCNRYGFFLSGLQAAFELQQKQADKALETQQWVTVFDELLKIFNWPVSERRLDSVEYQQLNRWRQVLNEFTSLANIDESVSGKFSIEEALNLLSRLVAGADFQAQTPQTPIQVLGMLEGGGLQFDAVWLLGMNDHLWPAAANPNPFIPVRLQQAMNMPHASPERELAFSKELLSSYRQSSPLVIASYALHCDDQPLRASTLINEFEPATCKTMGLQTTAAPHPYYQLEGEGELEQYVDNNGPALEVDTEQIAGGSAILKDQAACPFRAFARHRLAATELAEPEYHLSAAQRGTLLHRALEQLWKRLENTSGLLICDPEQLQETIRDAVRSALRPIAAQREDLFGERYQQSEIKRLSNLLGQWLELEKGRAPFEVIATEKALLVTVKGLPLRIRIDRIDRLSDGSLLLVDYKTGQCNTAKWQGERMEEPQLPLYSICMAGAEEVEGEVQALTFARISVDQLGFVGISSEGGVAPGIYSLNKSRGWNPDLSWADINQQWQQALESLAVEFMQGRALIDPVKNNTCQYCDLHALCRIHEHEGDTKTGSLG